VYYHFDYVGGPRNYKWINTNQIEKTWQQMDLAWQRGARNLWIVNVGDIKPMEFPLSFFMDQAWNPEAMTTAALANYPATWARSTFGPKQAKEIAGLVTRYAQLAAVRKPELIDAASFRLGEATKSKLDGGEFGVLMARWDALNRDLQKARVGVPTAQRAAFFQLVDHPIIALSNLYELYYDVAWNQKLAAANDPRADIFAARAEAAFKRDAEIAAQYHALSGGKWDGMMLQTHIGYTTWQQPDKDVMPEIKRTLNSAPGSLLRNDIVFAPPGSLSAKPTDIIIDAARFSQAHDGTALNWRTIPNLGRGGMGAVTTLPQGRPATSQADGVYLEYPVKIVSPGDAKVALHLAPTLDTSGGVDVRIGVSVDGSAMQTLSMRLTPSPERAKTTETRNWEKAVSDNDFVLEADFPGLSPGKHAIKVWRLDDNALLTQLSVTPTAPPPPK
jgi:hypothetical protein